MSEFRTTTFKKIAKKSGISNLHIKNDFVKAKKILKHSGPLTDLVKRQLNPSSFRKAFLNTPPGPEREELVLKEIIKRKPFQKLIPITTPGPQGSKITYKVMPDYITLDGIRVPMAGTTAQKIADHFGMVLPTPKMSKQIWQASDVKIRPQPLSAGGRIGGKYYSGEEVVKSKISDSDAAIAYSEMIEEELKKEKAKEDQLVAGHMKDIVQPEEDPTKLGLYGWFDREGDPIQKSPRTPHDTVVHTEYGAGVRLIDNEVTVEMPDGRKIKTTMDKILEHPEFSKAVSTTPGMKKYQT